MPRVLDASGNPIEVSHDQAAAAISSKQFSADPTETYSMYGPDGKAISVPGKSMDVALGMQYRFESTAGAVSRVGEEAASQRHRGIADKALAAQEALRRGASLGTTDVIDRIGGTSASELSARREGLGLAGTALEIAGGVLTGGAGSEVAAARVGAAVGGGVKGLAARGIVEGGAVGVGEGLSELALSEDDLTMERAAGALSSRALLGGGIGVGARLGGRAAEKALHKAGSVARAAGKRMQAAVDIPADLAHLDAAGLKAADAAEDVTLKAGRQAEQQALASDIVEHSKSFRGKDSPFLALDGKPSKEYSSTVRKIEHAAGEPVGIAERPLGMLDPLRRQAKIYDEALAGGNDLLAKLAAEDVRVSAKLRKSIAGMAQDETLAVTGKTSKRWGDLVGKPARKAELSFDDASRLADALDAGDLTSARERSFANLENLRAQNRDMIDRIVSFKEAPTSARKASIAAAMDMASAPKSLPKRLLDKATQGAGLAMIGGVVGGGPFGAMAAMAAPELIEAGRKLVSRLVSADGKAAAHTGGAVEKVMGLGRAVASKTPSKVPTATRILEQVAFGPKVTTTTADRAKSAGTQALIRAYEARASELQSQVEPDGMGGFQMTRRSRQDVADRLAGLRHVSPVAADRIETMAARRAAFLAEKMPKRPGWNAMQIGPDGWRPSNMAVRQFARYVDAVENPGGVEDRVSDGSITPMDAEAYKRVYPERFAAIVLDISTRLTEVRKKLPYKRRLALSIFTGIAIDPGFDPDVLSVLQNQFSMEEGTEGGTQPKVAQPQFGSVRKSLPEPTPAQSRGGAL